MKRNFHYYLLLLIISVISNSEGTTSPPVDNTETKSSFFSTPSSDTCEKTAACRPMNIPQEAGTASCTNGENVGSVCRVTCNRRYAFTGNRDQNVITCLAGSGDCPISKWNLERQFYCRPLFCHDFQNIANGTFKCNRGFKGGSICQYSCNEGYELDPIDHEGQICYKNGTWLGRKTPRCKDLDECTAMIDNCNVNGMCMNTVGSFACTCNAGYTGDGVNCTDIDECIENTDNCDASVMCKNTDGSFTCTCLNEELEIGSQNIEARFRNCHDVARGGFNQNGLYDVIINGTTVTVYCDLQQNVGEWLVIQRRQDGSEEFYRNWTEYERGFGNKSGEFWLGLANIHSLIALCPYEIRIDLEDWEGNTAFAVYSLFSVGNVSSNYRLSIGGYSGNAGDSMTADQNNQQFSTVDRDNDVADNYHCAQRFHGAWWYRGCSDSNLNGRYYRYGQSSLDGVAWWTWKRGYYSLKRAEMKIRPI